MSSTLSLLRPILHPMYSRLAMLLWLVAAVALGSQVCPGQTLQQPARFTTDSDHDGLSDGLEQALLEQFVPHLMIGAGDCADRPAEFQASIINPQVQAHNGTIYGQVFPAKGEMNELPTAEIHYFHLWSVDCGPHGHPLDAEHVSVLVRASGNDLSSAKWAALYWYAAAHENTVCDVSQIARASTLGAVDHGARVWISPGKHASYLDPALCRKGCGADQCQKMLPLASGDVVNLGEPAYPMNDAAFIASTAWPLADKMRSSNFPESALSRIHRLPEDDIAWFNDGRHPSQGVIAVSLTTGQAIAVGGRAADGGLSTASDATDNALSTARNSSGNALQKSYRRTKHALGASIRSIGKALNSEPKADSVQEPRSKEP